FDRRRRQQIRAEQHEIEFRQMLEAMMRLARTQQSNITEYQLCRILGENLEELRLRHVHYVRELESKYPYFFWRPHRNKDERLRELAMELQDANTQAGLLWLDMRYVPALEKVEDWDARANEVKERIDPVLKNIDQRLDELDW
ncbi:MAG: hypothetical protein Q8R28_06330, partial [Dehalococcoidia bacterium]|nr:hypothetical protein [Dehalococcoidia bacterium]